MEALHDSSDEILIRAASALGRIGPDANVGNVPAHSVIGLETLRLGLRADTLTAFE